MKLLIFRNKSTNQNKEIKKKRKKYYCYKCYFVTNADFYSKYIYLERHQHLN